LAVADLRWNLVSSDVWTPKIVLQLISTLEVVGAIFSIKHVLIHYERKVNHRLTVWFSNNHPRHNIIEGPRVENATMETLLHP